MRHAESTLQVINAARVPILAEVVLRMELVEIANAVQVTGIEHGLVGLADETWKKCKWHHEEQAEPEIGRMEKVMVVAVNRDNEPARLNDGVDSLGRRNEISSTGFMREQNLRCRPR